MLAQPLVVPQWGMAMDERKQKEVHCLHPKVFTVASAFQDFERQLNDLPTHIFKMARQWEALARSKAALLPFGLILEKDYQVILQPRHQSDTQQTRRQTQTYLLFLR